MSVLLDIQIIDGLISGHVVCRPLRPENIRGASIDLTLGYHFWRCDARPGGVFNPYSEGEIARYFAGPFVAKPYASVYEKIGVPGSWPLPVGYEQPWSKAQVTQSPFENIPDDWPVIVIRSGERILGCTHEFAGIRSPGTSQIHARSSSGRVGVKVCDDAGLGDPGWVSRWTLELSNNNEEAIILPVGERLIQMNLFETGLTRESYGTEKLYQSKYQESDDVDELIANWHPRLMLPRNYFDKRVEPMSLAASEYAAAIDYLEHERDRVERERVTRLNKIGSDSVPS